MISSVSISGADRHEGPVQRFVVPAVQMLFDILTNRVTSIWFLPKGRAAVPTPLKILTLPRRGRGGGGSALRALWTLILQKRSFTHTRWTFSQSFTPVKDLPKNFFFVCVKKNIFFLQTKSVFCPLRGWGDIPLICLKNPLLAWKDYLFTSSARSSLCHALYINKIGLNFEFLNLYSTHEIVFFPFRARYFFYLLVSTALDVFDPNRTCLLLSCDTIYWFSPA